MYQSANNYHLRQLEYGPAMSAPVNGSMLGPANVQGDFGGSTHAMPMPDRDFGHALSAGAATSLASLNRPHNDVWDVLDTIGKADHRMLIRAGNVVYENLVKENGGLKAELESSKCVPLSLSSSKPANTVCQKIYRAAHTAIGRVKNPSTTSIHSCREASSRRSAVRHDMDFERLQTCNCKQRRHDLRQRWREASVSFHSVRGRAPNRQRNGF